MVLLHAHCMAWAGVRGLILARPVQSSIQEMTGTVVKADRAEAWVTPHKRVFFATPQAFKNDAAKGGRQAPPAGAVHPHEPQSRL